MISGTPTVQQTASVHTVTASNNAGSTSVMLSIAVAVVQMQPATPLIAQYFQDTPPYLQISNFDPNVIIRLYYRTSPGVTKSDSFVIGNSDPTYPGLYYFDSLFISGAQRYYFRLTALNGQSESELTAEYNQYFACGGWTPTFPVCF